jgi:cytochrome c oxidase assembly protein subunit 15
VTLAVVTSPRFAAGQAAGASPVARAAGLTTALVFLQLLLGAVMRHTKAGLAIPDFPLALGRLVPPMTSFAVAIHFAHRVGALVVACAVASCVVLAVRSDRPGLARMAWLTAAIVAAQGILGALTVLSKKDVVITTAHVATGALLLGASLGFAILSRRRPALSAVASAKTDVRGDLEHPPLPEAVAWK